MKRVFLIVLDSLGIGALPDACDYGDEGANTIKSISKSKFFNIPTLKSLGIGNIEGLEFLGKTKTPLAAVGRAQEISKGKDTTTGHWEIAGLKLEKPFPTYPNGFPKEVLEPFCNAIGKEVLCNKTYSGTEVIKDYGQEHIESGKPIVYTSADSVFQVAAHTDIIPLKELYSICETARELLKGEHAVGRVIARPFTDKYPFVRTKDRHDYSLEPTQKTVLDSLKNNGKEVISIGKIKDIFADRGITVSHKTANNFEGMKCLDEFAQKDFNGLCFANLVDFDMVYGHRNDIDGYANALSEFDAWLQNFLPKLNKEDLLIITADHGCDPGYKGTDHTREYVPIIVYGDIKRVDLGTRDTYADIAATVSDIFALGYKTHGKSFLTTFKG